MAAQPSTIRCHRVDSSAVTHLAYDDVKRVAYVRFHSGRTYAYRDVSYNTFLECLHASSIGGTVNHLLVRAELTANEVDEIPGQLQEGPDPAPTPRFAGRINNGSDPRARLFSW